MAVLLALSPADKCRFACVCRAWRALAASPAAWASLDLRGVARANAALLRALAARARGALHSLALDAGARLPPRAVCEVALAADPRALVHLRVSAPPSPTESDDEQDAGAADAAAWRAEHAAALHALPLLALPLHADALDARLCSLLSAGRVHALWLERAEVGPAEAAALADAVLAAPPGCALRTLRLRLNAVGDPGAASLARLAGTLTSLELGWNDVGDAGAAALAGALERDASSLRELDLRHCAVGSAGAAALARALCAVPCCALARLSLLHNRLGAAGAAALARALRLRGCALRHLDLGYNGLGSRGVSELVRGGLGSLRSLGLAHNSVCAAGARDLARALASNATLTALDVGRNALGDEGCRELCVALRSHSALRAFAAPVTAVGPGAARRFGGLLRVCAQLTALDVSGNELRAGVVALAAGLADGGGELRTLRLQHVGCDDTGAHALASALRSGGAAVLGRPCSGGAAVAHLDLRGNPLGDDGARALAAAAALPASRLARLDLRDTFLGPADRGAADLRRAAAARQGRAPPLALLGVQ